MAVYQVWRLDCETCGSVADYGEDRDAVPDACEDCGAPAEEE